MDNLRRFLLVFVSMFFIAAAICGFVLARSYHRAAGEKVETLAVSAPTYDPNSDSDEKNTFRQNILCVVGDSGLPESELVFLINVDSVTESVSFLFVPRDMKYGIAESGAVGSFGSYCALSAGKSMEKAGRLLSSFLDLDIQYYMRMTTDTFGKLITAFSSEDNGVSFELPVALEYENGKTSISLPAGKQDIKGNEAAQLIRFYRNTENLYPAEMMPYYDGTDVKRVQMVQKFLNAFMRQKFTEASTTYYKEQFAELFHPYLTKSETNLNDTNLEQIGRVMEKLQQTNVNYYMLNGTEVYNQEVYLEYDGTMRNLMLDEAISFVKASDVLMARFKTGI